MLAKDNDLMFVEPEMPSKGKKQWKRLAQGDLGHLKEQEKVVAIVGGGKRPSESNVQSADASKKLKHHQVQTLYLLMNRRWLLYSLVEHYELFCFECTWAWEPTRIQRA